MDDGLTAVYPSQWTYGHMRPHTWFQSLCLSKRLMLTNVDQPQLFPLSLIMDFPLWKFATETHFNCSVNQSDIHSSKYFFVCSNHSFIPHRIWRVGTIICNSTTHQSTPPQKSSNWKMIASVAAATNIYLGLPKWDRFPWNEFLFFALKKYMHFFLINIILIFS